MADDNLERITILLQAKDRDFARAMDRNNKLIARMTRDASKNTADMTRKIDSSLGAISAKAGSFAKSFAAGLAGGVVTTAFASLTTGLGATIKSVAQLGDEAKRSGLGLEAFQEWKFVAEQNRIGVDQLVDGFKELNLRADELIQTGAGPAAESFKRLGLSAADLKTKLRDPSSLMLEIIGRLEGMDKAAQIRIADEVFGGSAGERFVELLAQGDDGLRQIIARAHEVGAVMQPEMIDKAQDLDRRWGELQTRLSSILKMIAVDGVGALDGFYAKASELGDYLPAYFQPDLLEDLIALYDRIGESAGDAAGGASAAVSEAASLASINLRDEAQATATALYQMVDALDAVGNDSAAAVEEVADKVQAIADAAVNGKIEGDALRSALTDVSTEADAALRAVQGIDGITLDGALSQVGRLVGYLNAAAQAAKNAVAASGQVTIPGGGYTPEMGRFPPITGIDLATPNAPASSPRPGASPFGADVVTVDNFSPSRGGGGGSSRATDRYADKIDAFKEETAALLAEAEALNAAALSFDEYGIAQDVARQKAELLQAAQNAGKEITPQLTAEIDALANGYADAARKAEEARERHDEFAAAVDQVKGTLGDAFEGLATGAMTFNEALRSVASSLVSMAANRAFESLWSSITGSTGGGFFGSLFGFASGGYTGAGSRNQPAGVVHKGEVVFSQDDIRRAGGVAAVEAMRRSGATAMAPVSASGVGAAGGSTVQIINTTGAPAREERQVGPDGRETLRVIVGEEIGKGAFSKQMASRYAVKDRSLKR